MSEVNLSPRQSGHIECLKNGSKLFVVHSHQNKNSKLCVIDSTNQKIISTIEVPSIYTVPEFRWSSKFEIIDGKYLIYLRELTMKEIEVYVTSKKSSNNSNNSNNIGFNDKDELNRFIGIFCINLSSGIEKYICYLNVSTIELEGGRICSQIRKILILGDGTSFITDTSTLVRVNNWDDCQVLSTKRFYPRESLSRNAFVRPKNWNVIEFEPNHLLVESLVKSNSFWIVSLKTGKALGPTLPCPIGSCELSIYTFDYHVRKAILASRSRLGICSFPRSKEGRISISVDILADFAGLNGLPKKLTITAAKFLAQDILVVATDSPHSEQSLALVVLNYSQANFQVIQNLPLPGRVYDIAFDFGTRDVALTAESHSVLLWSFDRRGVRLIPAANVTEAASTPATTILTETHLPALFGSSPVIQSEPSTAEASSSSKFIKVRPPGRLPSTHLSEVTHPRKICFSPSGRYLFVYTCEDVYGKSYTSLLRYDTTLGYYTHSCTLDFVAYSHHAMRWELPIVAVDDEQVIYGQHVYKEVFIAYGLANVVSGERRTLVKDRKYKICVEHRGLGKRSFLLFKDKTRFLTDTLYLFDLDKAGGYSSPKLIGRVGVPHLQGLTDKTVNEKILIEYDESRVIVSSADQIGGLYLLNIDTNEVTHSFQPTTSYELFKGPSPCTSLSPDKQLLVIANGGQLEWWDLSNIDEPQKNVKILSEARRLVCNGCLAFTKDRFLTLVRPSERKTKGSGQVEIRSARSGSSKFHHQLTTDFNSYRGIAYDESSSIVALVTQHCSPPHLFRYNDSKSCLEVIKREADLTNSPPTVVHSEIQVIDTVTPALTQPADDPEIQPSSEIPDRSIFVAWRECGPYRTIWPPKSRPAPKETFTKDHWSPDWFKPVQALHWYAHSDLRFIPNLDRFPAPELPAVRFFPSVAIPNPPDGVTYQKPDREDDYDDDQEMPSISSDKAQKADGPDEPDDRKVEEAALIELAQRINSGVKRYTHPRGGINPRAFALAHSDFLRARIKPEYPTSAGDTDKEAEWESEDETTERLVPYNRVGLGVLRSGVEMKGAAVIGQAEISRRKAFGKDLNRYLLPRESEIGILPKRAPHFQLNHFPAGSTYRTLQHPICRHPEVDSTHDMTVSVEPYEMAPVEPNDVSRPKNRQQNHPIPAADPKHFLNLGVRKEIILREAWRVAPLLDTENSIFYDYVLDDLVQELRKLYPVLEKRHNYIISALHSILATNVASLLALDDDTLMRAGILDAEERKVILSIISCKWSSRRAAKRRLVQELDFSENSLDELCNYSPISSKYTNILEEQKTKRVKTTNSNIE